MQTHLTSASVRVSVACTYCGHIFPIFPSKLLLGRGRFCSQTCRLAARNDIDWCFWSKVARGGPDECWPWTGSNTRGYGNVTYRGKAWKTHRLAYTLVRGPIPDGLNVLHHCDNPPCCNVAHHFLGTDLDNTIDRIAKGRSCGVPGDRNGSRTRPDALRRGDDHPFRVHPELQPRGQGHGMARLTDEKVRTIRCAHLEGRGYGEIARLYDVNKTTIARVVTRKSWAHVG